MTKPVDLRIISLGAGVQSSALYLMACTGEIGPKPDYAIFADTQAEPPWVYEQLNYMERIGDIPIRRPTMGNLLDAITRGVQHGERFSSVPFWVDTKNGPGAPSQRQCTFDYKIAVVRKEIRNLLGLKKGDRVTGKFNVEQWIGISTDEVHRAKPSQVSWITNRFPLMFDLPMRRTEILTWMQNNGHPKPDRSACTFCPYRSPSEYARWRREEPELFEQACQVDELIRSNGTMRGMNGKQYILKSLQPLRDLDPENTDQLDLFGEECEGMCGV